MVIIVVVVVVVVVLACGCFVVGVVVMVFGVVVVVVVAGLVRRVHTWGLDLPCHFFWEEAIHIVTIVNSQVIVETCPSGSCPNLLQ